MSRILLLTRPNQVNNITDERTDIRRELGDLYAELREGLQAVDVVKQELQQEKALVEAMRHELEEKERAINHRLTSLEASILPGYGIRQQIAFSVASTADFGPVTVATNIPFPVVNVNVGAAWITVINAFQAPISGIYFVSASIASDDGAVAAIIHTDAATGHRVAAMTTSTSSQTGDANIALVELAAEDYLSVHLLPENSGKVISAADLSYCTFSGFLLLAQ